MISTLGKKESKSDSSSVKGKNKYYTYTNSYASIRIRNLFK
jgi:hypothetical protein